MSNSDKKAEYRRRYRETHKEQIKQRAKKYRETHREQLNEYAKKYQKENKDKVNAYQREYQRAHREYIRAYQANRRKSKSVGNKIREYHKNYMREYRKDNIEYSIAETNRRFVKRINDKYNTDVQTVAEALAVKYYNEYKILATEIESYKAYLKKN